MPVGFVGVPVAEEVLRLEMEVRRGENVAFSRSSERSRPLPLEAGSMKAILTSAIS